MDGCMDGWMDASGFPHKPDDPIKDIDWWQAGRQT